MWSIYKICTRYFYSWIYMDCFRKNFSKYFWLFLKVCAIIFIIVITWFIVVCCQLICIFRDEYMFVVYLISLFYFSISTYYIIFYFPNTRIFNLLKYYTCKLYNRFILINFRRVFKIIANTILISLIIIITLFPQHFIVKYHIKMAYSLFVVLAIWSFFFGSYLRNNSAAAKLFFTIIIFIFWGVILCILLYYLYLWFMIIYAKGGYFLCMFFFF